jgi:hypothetical protein
VAPPRPDQHALDALLDGSKEACHTRLRARAKCQMVTKRLSLYRAYRTLS